LSKNSGKSAHALENKLGISHGRIHRWLKEFEEDPHNSFMGNRKRLHSYLGHRTPEKFEKNSLLN